MFFSQKILVVGGGGREHALVWKLAQSPHVSAIFCAPGNAGIETLATCVSIEVNHIEELAQFAIDHDIDLTLVGPEIPLSLGIVDLFESKDLKIFGPNKEASQFESSKAFSKKFMKKHGIPSADYREFTQYEEAVKWVSTLPLAPSHQESGASIVIKADGLAAGKGVRICKTFEESTKSLQDFMCNKIFGEDNARVVVEEFLKGEELSYLILCDGNSYLPLASSQDHKRLLDNDEGPNTGGMGAYSPARNMSDELEFKIKTRIVEPFLKGCLKEGIHYKGILYIGLMIIQGDPYVLEFNVRFGDPETQALMLRLDSDLIEVILSCLKGEISQFHLEWKNEAALCVVMVSNGYPDHYKKGFTISGLEKLGSEHVVFHAGTQKMNHHYVSHGGRVLCIGSLGTTLEEAHEKAYRAVSCVHWDGVHYRKDIGKRGEVL
ncbi:MAG: phosphoribosylamine--glycine ligase [Deltaproteobacteria bacterium]|nr:phosphoribosylamine--glycine ligase [Deltaproteobacteria bacterium]